VWAKAEELGVPLFIHPTGIPEFTKKLAGNGWLTNTVGYPLETTIALSHLIFEGTFDRFPKLKVIAAHGGGFLPSYSDRSDHACLVSPRSCNPGDRNADALVDAAFGSVVTEVRTFEDGRQEIKDVRIADGYWGDASNPRHRNLSGIVLLPKPHLWDLREDRWQPLHLRNPWAERPVSADLLPLPGFAVAEDGSITPADGTRLADILGLPAEWPPAG
jgi:hypothetical protein